MKRISKLGNRPIWLGTLLGAGLLLVAQASADTPSRGVVVEELPEGSALIKAGVRPGDVLLTWKREEQGEIASPFDWQWVEIEEAPRGTVTISGERQDTPMTFVVELGAWNAKVRPRISGALLDDYLRGRELIDAGKLEDGISLLQQAAEGVRDEDWPLRCWLSLRIGHAWAAARVWDEAERAYREALEQARDPRPREAVWEALGNAWEQQSEWDQAQEAYRSALEIREKIWGESLGVARNQRDLGMVAQAHGDLETAEVFYQRALKIQERLAPNSLELATSFDDLGIVAVRRGDLDLAEAYFERDLAITEKLAPDSFVLAITLGNLGLVARFRGDLDGAEAYFQRNLATMEKWAPNSLELASTLINLGELTAERGDLDEAEAYIKRALVLTQELAPDSLELANTFQGLGIIANNRGDLDRAETYYQRELAIKERLAPGSLLLASTLNNLGAVVRRRGDLDAAKAYYERALAIVEKRAPDSLQLAAVLGNLGIVAKQRGDLELAGLYHDRAVAMTEKCAPDSPSLASALNNRGLIAQERGDLEAAEADFERSLSIREKLAPKSLGFALSLLNLGSVAMERRELDVAEAYHQQGLAMIEELAPQSLHLADVLDNLGTIALRRGDPELAEVYGRRALSIFEELAPNSLELAGTLSNLGDVAKRRGNPDAAESYYQRSSAITGQLAPGSLLYAMDQRKLGKLLAESDRLNEAVDHLLLAIHVLEEQISRLGVSYERQGDYRAQRGGIYRDAIDVLLKLHHPAAALHTLERFRARSLLAMLTERDLIFSNDVPEDLEKARRLLARRYDRILEQMESYDAEKDQQQIEKLSKELRDLRRERDDIAEKIREISPRLADLQYPAPLTLSQIRGVLDPGTVLLAYSVGEEETHIFAVTGEEGLVAVKTQALGEEKLRAAVDDFRRAIVDGTDRRSQFFQGVQDAGRELYRLLIQPVASAIEPSDRVLLLPDGPLYRLPFSALIRESGEYLAEWKPVHFVLSATLYGELQRRRPRTGDSPSRVAAFGDPVYPQELRRKDPQKITDLRVRSAVERGMFDWKSLPYTRREVEGIAALYAAERVDSYLGEEATEERVKGLARSTDIVHFAVHGYLDDRFPLNSAVALTIPQGFPEDRDNGLLQAWEIFERVRLDADLVVLSACRSALGEERGGEGLIGLTRAFQYAGARSVAATLWQVTDEVTAELMVRFYRHLRAGKPKDAALQAAQIELLRGPIEVQRASGEVVMRDASAPYYWAAFQLIGDWR